MTFSDRAVEAAANKLARFAPMYRKQDGTAGKSAMIVARDMLTAALAVDGLALVPKEPTREMLKAAFKEANEQLLRTDGNTHCKSDEERSAHAIAPIYRAMLTAASDGEVG